MKIICPRCFAEYEVQPDVIGQKVECQQCKNQWIAKSEPTSTFKQTSTKSDSISISEPTPEMKPCPLCGESILAVAKKCRYCGEYLTTDSIPIRSEVVVSDEKKSAHSVEVSFSAGGTRKCPYCQKDVEKEAVTCPYCHGTFVSSNRIRNAIGMIIVFLLLYWLISSFVSCEADREMKKIEHQIETLMKF